MQAAIIGLLFTVLVIALVLGYVMFRLSETPKISDVNDVIASVNELAEAINQSITKNSEDVETNKASNEDLRTLYDSLLIKANKNANDIASYSGSNLTLAQTASDNTENIDVILDDLTGYVTTSDLEETVSALGEAWGEVLQFNDGEHLKIDDDGKLVFCNDDTCHNLT